MPTNFFPRTTGTPEMLLLRMMATASPSFFSGEMVIGSAMSPASNFFTLPTSAACASGVMLR